jgi:hypothetical protein
MKNWRSDARVELFLEGTRGTMTEAGEVGLADFIAGTYPACSRHGAMTCLSVRHHLWRCLAEECNIGAKVDPAAILPLGAKLGGQCFCGREATLECPHCHHRYPLPPLRQTDAGDTWANDWESDDL